MGLPSGRACPSSVQPHRPSWLSAPARTRTNLAKKDVFSLKLTEAIASYHNRSVNALQVIQELLKLA